MTKDNKNERNYAPDNDRDMRRPARRMDLSQGSRQVSCPAEGEGLTARRIDHSIVTDDHPGKSDKAEGLQEPSVTPNDTKNERQRIVDCSCSRHPIVRRSAYKEPGGHDEQHEGYLGKDHAFGNRGVRLVGLLRRKRNGFYDHKPPESVRYS